MGSALAGHALAAGIPVVGYDIDAGARDRFRGRGGTLAESAGDVAERSEVLLTSLPTVEAFHEVLRGPDGVAARARPGLVWAEISTLPLAVRLAAESELAGAGITLLDAPLSGTGAQARTRDVVVFLSGEPAAKRRATPVLLAMTRAVYDVGGFGNGSRMKFVANLLVAVHNLAAAESLVLAERAGLDLDQVLRVVGDGAGGSRMFDLRGPLMAQGRYTDPTVRLRVFWKDIEIIDDFAATTGAPTPLFDVARDFYRAALSGGLGEEDSAAVVEILRAS